MSELTDDELNLKIAESLEPMPACKPRLPRNEEFPTPRPDRTTSKYWEFIFGDCTKHPGWQPRDFVNDPAMKCLLQSKLIEMRYKVQFWMTRPGTLVGRLEILSGQVIHVDSTKERFWAEAYAKSKGLL